MKKTIPDSAVLIPENAQAVFRGQIFEIFQWPQRMFDATTATFEMLRRPDTVQIVAIKDNELVLVNDEQPGRKGARLHFPGGRVDPEDASWLTAAKRELLEETGLEFEDWRLVHVEQPHQKIEWFVSFFIATNFKKASPQHVDKGGEKIEVVSRDFYSLRTAVLAGEAPSLNFAIPLFLSVSSLEELSSLPQFIGQEVDR